MGLARSRANHDFEEGRWLALAARQAVHVRLGYGSFTEYVERWFGYAPRLTLEKLRVGEALESLPLSAHALQSAQLTWSALRELTRVATPATEREWLAAARDMTAREVERLVSGHAPGSRPNDAPDARARRHVLRFEVSAEVLATFRDALAKVRRDAGSSLDDDAALLLLARHVLGGPADDGRSSYQVMLSVCENCRRAQQQGDGERIQVDAAMLATAECDAQRISVPHVGSGAVRDRESARAANAKRHDEPPHVAHARAAQTVPPAIRRLVLARDAGRCVVPGCRHATFVDVHHIRPRAEGGRHDADNLVTVCSAHHRALHRGRLFVDGRPSAGLSFRHADNTKYGSAVDARRADVRARAFRALRTLGFAEAEAKRALARSRPDGDTALESVVRCALSELA